VWLGIVTMTAGYMKIFSPEPRLGFLSHARSLQDMIDSGNFPASIGTAANAAKLMTNDRLDAAVAAFFMISVIVILVASAIEWYGVISGRKPAVSSEVPYEPRLVAAAGD
jgi:carbon starvation protein